MAMRALGRPYFWMAIVLISVSCCGGKEGVRANLKPFPYKRVENIDQVEFDEPSGIVFHPVRGTLFVVGDRGDLGEFETDGTPVRQRRLTDADFEGITVDPMTGLLYVAVEGEEKILEVDPERMGIRREFTIGRVLAGKEVLVEGERGVEGITFAPAEDHPEGGVFYIANQGLVLDGEEDVSALCELELPLRSSAGGGPVELGHCFTPKVIDLSGMQYDRGRDLLYVISDAMDIFLEFTRAGEVLHTYILPERDQEGITFDADGFLYIACDSGGIIKYQLKSETQP